MRSTATCVISSKARGRSGRHFTLLRHPRASARGSRALAILGKIESRPPRRPVVRQFSGVYSASGAPSALQAGRAKTRRTIGSKALSGIVS